MDHMKHAFACLGALLIMSAGCRDASRGDDLLADQMPARPRGLVTTSDDGRPLALVNGQPVTMAHLNAALLEIGGGEALSEHALDLMLADEARRRGVHVTTEDVAAERRHFLDSLRDAGIADAEQDAESMLATVRRTRGLGPARFEALLRRTAMLRALIQDDVVVTDEMVALAHEIQHGEKRRVRVLATHTLADAQAALAAIAAGATFGEAAARLSIDPSAARGGLVEPISPADPSYPEALRAAMKRLRVGEISQPLVVDDGFVVIQLEGVDPPTGLSLDETREAVARRVRRQQERSLMAELADRLRRRAQITTLDPHLRYSSEAR